MDHEFDIALKGCLRHLTAEGFRQLTGTAVERWLEVELSEVRQSQPDLLGETAEGDLLHIELESNNDADIAPRMAGHAIAIFRKRGRWPKQVVLYFGSGPPRMPSSFRAFEWRVVNVQELDGEPLLASDQVDDNVVALLLRLEDERAALRHILWRLAQADAARREPALKALVVLAGLRRLVPVLDEEARKMPIGFEYAWARQVMSADYG